MAERKEMTMNGSSRTARSIRIHLARALAVLAPVLALSEDAFAQAAHAKVPIGWKGRKLDAAALPKDFAAAPAEAIRTWEPWAKQAGYRMDLDASGRVLVLSPADGSRGVKVGQIVERAESWFDGLLPKPPARTGDPGPSHPENASSPSEVIPEDPEGPPPGAEKKGPAKKVVASWGSGSTEPDSQTGTLIALADEADQKSLLAFLAAAKPELAEWAGQAAGELGFVLEIPLVAAYVENAAGQEEWNADHEVLNRAVRLLAMRRFGQLPYWLVHGIAWEAENAFDGSIWVYPFRAEFVYTVEHGAWPSDLANEFQGRASEPLKIEELTRWKSRTWDGECARHAFGVVHFLAATKKAELPSLLEDLRRYRDANNRKPGPDGAWTRDPSWEPPAEAQAAILQARCGDKALEEAGAWLAKQTAARAKAENREK
jgi:hypothetical protein